MNFDEIKKKYPKAWEMWRLFTFKYVHGMEFLAETDIEYISGWLFKFFDEQKLVIMVTLSGRWYWRVCSLEIPTVWSNLKTPGLDNRQQAEQAAFIKAFEILDKP